MTIKNISLVGFSLCMMACGCTNKTSTNTFVSQTYEKVSPDFDADSAYHYIDKQVGFGPRVPNTKEHVACGDYLVNELKRFGAEVTEQKMVVTAYNGTKLNSRNIIGSYGLDKQTRVLLFAHWDTRPFSDHDPNPDNYHKPILGANDAASGVGVLLEVARNIHAKSPEIGVDIIFFDSEDYGPPAFEPEKPGEWWCLGSQYWSKNPHIPNYKAKYGILLDMVGAPDATFYKESMSMHYAPDIVEKVWGTAGNLNYGAYFIGKKRGGVTDDHLYVNQYRNIPSIDIIHLDSENEYSFAHYWHTQNDDMSNISKETLKAVGQTVLEVIYNEKEQKN